MLDITKAIKTIQHLLPAGVVIKGGDLRPPFGIIFPEEEMLMATAVEKRRREFFAGRIYARQGLLELGQKPVPILPKLSRAPSWPEGFVGSISHCDSVCAAVVGRSSKFHAIGLDIESDSPLGKDVTMLVCRPIEISERDKKEQLLGIDIPKLIFVIKEA